MLEDENITNKWEYEIIGLPKESGEMKAKLNEYGQKGWEVINIIQHPSPKEFLNATKTNWFAFLKKQIGD